MHKKANWLSFFWKKLNKNLYIYFYVCYTPDFDSCKSAKTP